ncbi:YkuS family protein [Candidatus Formimonas warabiya]|uniref:YkuS family protein n=1 Tax=Formimonas warabiya TaxID=1761012 RepID=A0A3G1KVC4_FORW1|nr:YkuS family protein [Candidatus Formimonas warabiya]ATW26391.1 hypothetical protein DCMF_17965 [Candidatus Formimonas warabiya]
MTPNQTIAVEDGLQNVKQALEAQGYTTVDMSRVAKAGCIVTTGMDQNFLGREDVQRDIPVVIAKGKSAQEVVNDVKRFVQ